MTRYLVTEIRSVEFRTEAELKNGMAPTEEALREAAFDVILEEIGIGTDAVAIDYLTLDFHEHEMIMVECPRCGLVYRNGGDNETCIEDHGRCCDCHVEWQWAEPEEVKCHWKTVTLSTNNGHSNKWPTRLLPMLASMTR